MKYIRMNKNLKELFKKQLDDYEGPLESFRFKMPKLKKKEQILIKFAPGVWTTAQYIVQCCSDEVAILFTSTFDRKGRVVYLRSVHIPPQIVTGTFVETDDKYYGKWLNDLPLETINSLRCEGHSHVNMQASPSGQDESNWPKIITNVKDYYLFLIFNKRGDLYSRLYDIQENIIYESHELNVDINTNIPEVLKKAIKKGGSFYDGYNEGYGDSTTSSETKHIHNRLWGSRKSRG